MSSLNSVVVEVPVLVIQVEAPNVLHVRKSSLSEGDRNFLRSVEDYCGRIFSSSASSRWRTSLNERHLNVGDKYFALDSRTGGSQWRRGRLSNVVTVRGGHRACVYLMDEARSIDVPLNHILPMPDSFGDRPPMLRKVVISGIRPCSLVTDSLTCQTDYGPSATWDTAAEQYCKKLFLFNPGLSDVRLRHIRLHAESKVCLADLSFRFNDRIIGSYAQHLRQLRYATNDDARESFALATIAPVANAVDNDNSGLMPPFESLSSLTLIDEMGSFVRCHKVDSSSSICADRDANNEESDIPKIGSKQHVLLEEEALERSNIVAPRDILGRSASASLDRMKITFTTDYKSNRSVLL